MKKIVLFFTFAALALAASAQLVTLNVSFGVLSDASGTPLPDTTLVQIIGSSDSIFADPTTSSFVGSSNDVIIYSGGLDSTTSGVSGAAVLSLANIPYANYYLTLRWFPSLTTASTAPGATSYGQYGYANSSLWVAPAAGSTASIDFLTTSIDSSSLLSDSLGRAILSTAAIPEPSTYLLMGAGLGLVGLAIRRRVKQF